MITCCQLCHCCSKKEEKKSILVVVAQPNPILLVFTNIKPITQAMMGEWRLEVTCDIRASIEGQTERVTLSRPLIGRGKCQDLQPSRERPLQPNMNILFFLFKTAIVYLLPSLLFLAPLYALVPTLVCYLLHQSFLTKLQTPDLDNNFIWETAILSSLATPLLTLLASLYLIVPFSLLLLYNISAIATYVARVCYNSYLLPIFALNIVFSICSLSKSLFDACVQAAQAQNLPFPSFSDPLLKPVFTVISSFFNLVLSILKFKNNIANVELSAKAMDAWKTVEEQWEAIRSYLNTRSSDILVLRPLFTKTNVLYSGNISESISNFSQQYIPLPSPDTPSLDAFFAATTDFIASLNFSSIFTNYMPPHAVMEALLPLSTALFTLSTSQPVRNITQLLFSNKSLPPLISFSDPHQYSRPIPVMLILFILLSLPLVSFCITALKNILPVLLSARFHDQPTQNARGTLHTTLAAILPFTLVQYLPFIICLSLLPLSMPLLITLLGHVITLFPIHLAAHIYFARQVARKNILNRQDISLIFSFFRVALGIFVFTSCWSACTFVKVSFVLFIPKIYVLFLVGDLAIFALSRGWCSHMCDSLISEEQVFFMSRDRRDD